MLLSRYTRWLHTRWPAGTVEKLPDVREDGATAVPGVRIVGDLTGIPLLKFAADSGARAVRAIVAEPGFAPGDGESLDLAIIGGGVAGIAAALEAREVGLNFQVFEATQNFSTIVNFPKAKPIYTYPNEMTPAGKLRLTANVKEDLIEELERQRLAAGIEPVASHIEYLEPKGDVVLLHHEGATTKARRVIVAIGRSGNFRKLHVAGEDLDKVSNRLHDPNDYADKDVLVVGGGDSALETAIATAMAGARVTISYRRDDFSRAKPENVTQLRQLIANPDADVAIEEPSSERVTTAFTDGLRHGHPHGTVRLLLGTQVTAIRPNEVDLKNSSGATETIPNEYVFAMIGREPPLDFFRRSGIPIRGEWRAKQFVGFALFTLFCLFIYHWKSGAKIPFTGFSVKNWFAGHGWFPFNMRGVIESLSHAASQPNHFLYTLKASMAEPSFYYTLCYSVLVVVFGIRRIRRRKTPYVKWQTWTLIAIQCLPLFVLPELALPWAGRSGMFENGTALGGVADQLFESYDDIGHERAYWRSYGFILAWPLFVANFFSSKPMWGWLIVGSLQTFVIIPLLIRRWGKGAYCGWICPCGALAETLGDRHRHKMPHGPLWNRLNMVGQGILAFAFALLLLRVVGWIAPNSFAPGVFKYISSKMPVLNYKWLVDLMLAGVVGVACYFWFSGRVWCRFACPLAALMHIYARFSRFRIFAEKKKCISCNVCTSVCHQGIDVMSFANKGEPMQDPQCVRCSACVQSCPTATLSFGRYNDAGEPVYDRLAASPVRMAEVPNRIATLPVVR